MNHSSVLSYLVFYLLIGVLFASAMALRRGFNRNRAFIEFLGAAFLWPLVIAITPKILLRLRENHTSYKGSQDQALNQKFGMLMEANIATLSSEEKAHLAKVVTSGIERITIFGDTANFKDIFESYWNFDVPPEAYYALKRARWNLKDQDETNDDVRFSRREPDWYIGFSNEFVKSIAKADKKKQGRVLEAISKISIAPTEPYGDTIKPLSGDHIGLWRCRIGDDRLIYFPDAESKKVILVCFSARGDAYQDAS